MSGHLSLSLSPWYIYIYLYIYICMYTRSQVSTALDATVKSRNKVFVYRTITDKLEPLINLTKAFLSDCTFFSFFVYRDPAETPMVLPSLEILRARAHSGTRSLSLSLSLSLSQSSSHTHLSLPCSYHNPQSP